MNSETSQHFPFTTHADYSNALDTLCGLTSHNLLFFEKDFINIGFNNSERIEMFRHLLLSNPNNRLQLLAHDTRHISQYCPRLMTLLRQFGHNMFIYQTPKQLQHISEPFGVGDDANFIRRFHFDYSKGVLGQNDYGNTSLLKSKFTEMWQQSQPSAWTSSFIL